MLEPFRHRTIITHPWGIEKTITDGPHTSARILTIYPNQITSNLHYHGGKHELLHIIKGFLYIQIYNCLQDKLTNNIEDWGLIFNYCLTEGMSVNISPFSAHRYWAYEDATIVLDTSNVTKPNDTIILQHEIQAPN